MSSQLNQRLDAVLNSLQDRKGFQMNDLAVKLGCSTETLRRIRKGHNELSCEKMVVIIEQYGVNPHYFIYGEEPMFLEHASEPKVHYCALSEIELLRRMLKDKEQIIQLLEKQLAEKNQ